MVTGTWMHISGDNDNQGVVSYKQASEDLQVVSVACSTECRLTYKG